jgi:hypothetical protein
LAAALGTVAVLTVTEDGGGVADEMAIKETIKRAILTTDPAICNEVFTRRSLQVSFALSTEPPSERCRQADPEHPAREADSLRVSAISVDGDRATARVKARGGNIGRATLEVRLVEDRGWNVGKITDIAVDREAYLAAGRSVAASSAPAAAQELTRCMLDYADGEVTAAQIERSLLAGNEGYLVGAFGGCRREFRKMILSPATIGARTDYSRSQLRCTSRVLGSLIDGKALKTSYRAWVQDRLPPRSVEVAKLAALSRCTG